MQNGFSIWGGENINKAIVNLNRIVSIVKKKIDAYIEEKRKELTEELELKEIENL